jgi:hypothetical protein
MYTRHVRYHFPSRRKIIPSLATLTVKEGAEIRIFRIAVTICHIRYSTGISQVVRFASSFLGQMAE